ncbi:unnamed protein product [Porites evermanni]|uniref:GIY-YIG domain-containing protein n=1 Tax=Porites evermanni TaxID=104178 RepID=A0ABN8S450_9CNID|nr:unnamed protein product [Porites evermanni]
MSLENTPKMEIVNSYLNSDFNSGEIYKIEFKNCDKVYIGNTTGELQTRLTQHLTNNKSPVYQYRLHKPTIKLLVNAPSKGKRELEKVEHEWIYDFSEKLGDQLLNKQGIKPKRQEVKYQAQMTAIDAFQKNKIQKLGKTLRIKDDVTKNLLYYDGTVDGRGYRNVAQCKQQPREEAISKLTKKQQELIKELTIDFN